MFLGNGLNLLFSDFNWCIMLDFYGELLGFVMGLDCADSASL